MKINDAVKLAANSLKASVPVTAATPKAGLTRGLAAGQSEAARALVSGRDALPQASIGHKAESLKSQLTDVERASSAQKSEANKLQLEANRREKEEDSAKESGDSARDRKQAMLDNVRKTLDILTEIHRQSSLL